MHSKLINKMPANEAAGSSEESFFHTRARLCQLLAEKHGHFFLQNIRQLLFFETAGILRTEIRDSEILIFGISGLQFFGGIMGQDDEIAVAEILRQYNLVLGDKHFVHFFAGSDADIFNDRFTVAASKA